MAKYIEVEKVLMIRRLMESRAMVPNNEKGWQAAIEIYTEEFAKSPDSNVEKNREMLLQRSVVGLAKYGVTTDNNPLMLRAWLQHALEEALDMANYLQAAISKLDEEGANHDNANRQ